MQNFSIVHNVSTVTETERRKLGGGGWGVVEGGGGRFKVWPDIFLRVLSFSLQKILHYF